MSILLNRFKEELKGNEKLGQESKPMPAYSTGLDVFDYRNGKYDTDGNVQAGIDGGKICTIVGKAGVGKTTLAIQMACNIADQFPESQVIHLDVERATDPVRVMNLANWDQDHYQKKYIHMNENLTAESIYATIKALADMKLELIDELSYDTGMTDLEGNPVMRPQPTVVILDSIAMIAPEKLEEEETMSGQMSAAAIAKANTYLFKRIPGILNDANIILLAVNHVTQKIDINPMQRTSADLNFLRQDESLPGGRAPNYVANYLIKLEAGKKLTPDKEFGIKGYHINGHLIKSRSGTSGIVFKAIYDQANGYSNVLSNYNLLKEDKRVGGAGRSFHLKANPDIKFAQRQLLEKYNENEELRETFDKEITEVLLEYIPRPGFLDKFDGHTFEESELTEVETEDGEKFYQHNETKQYYYKQNDRYYEVEEQ